MPRDLVSRRNTLRLMIVGVISPFVVGCGGLVGEIAVAVLVIKMIAGAAAAILIVRGIAWQVESAQLDAEHKRLLLQGVKEGKKARSTIELTDEEISLIKEKGKLEIQFEDGHTAEVSVTFQ